MASEKKKHFFQYFVELYFVEQGSYHNSAKCEAEETGIVQFIKDQ